MGESFPSQQKECEAEGRTPAYAREAGKGFDGLLRSLDE